MRKSHGLIIGILLMISVTTIAEASRLNMMVSVEPVINNTYYTYNISGTGKTGGGYWLYNDTTTIFLNGTRLNETIDDRVVGGSESDPLWELNYTAYNDTWTSTYNDSYDTAFGWGDHGAAGYLTSYTDTNASTACGAGEFLNGDGSCDAGFLDDDGTDDDNPEAGDVDWTDLTDQGSFTDAKYCTYASGTGYISCTSEGGGISSESDPLWELNYTAYNDTWTSTYNDSYDTAFGWGDHGAAGYLTSYTDTNASTACGAGEFLNGDGSCDAGFLDDDGTDDDNPEAGDVDWTDLTDAVASTNINTTASMRAYDQYICYNETTCWRIYVNATGCMRYEAV